MYYLAVLSVLTATVEYSVGHGYLKDPPGRSSVWRPPYSIPVPIKNYNDNGLNCGGKSNMIAHGGRCGVCGDPYQGPYKNEAGGIYATGIIVKNYREGENITVEVMITADHRGFFEFRLCVNNDINKRITHDCLDKHLLREAGTGKTKLQFPPFWGVKTKVLSLPVGLTCSQCVLQWKYVTANSPGSVEEQFYACSDIAIISENGSAAKKTSQTPAPTTVRQTTSSTSTHASSSIEITDTPKATTTPKAMTSTSALVSTSLGKTNCRCRRIGIPALNAWCKFQCKNFVCPSYLDSVCVCE